MKKIILFLLISISSYGQILADEGVQITGGQPTVTSTPFLTTTETSGVQGKIDPVNLPFSSKLGWKSPQDYGAVGNGISDDSAAIIACLLVNDNVFLYGSYKTSQDLPIKTGQYVFSNNATITRTTTTGVGSIDAIIKTTGANSWTIAGNLTLVGAGKVVGTSRGIYIDASQNFKISNLTIKNISGNGLEFYTPSNLPTRGNRGVVNNISLQNNWIGAHWDIRAEYTTVNNIMAGGNHLALEILAGNTNIINGSISDNDNGIYLGGSTGNNNSHGIFSGLNVNHNTGYNLKAENVEYGQSIVGCHFYSALIDLGVNIVNSKGISFDGCTFDGNITNSDANTPKGVHILSNCLFESVFTPTGDPLIFKDCFTKTGGMYSGNNDTGRFTKNLKVIGGTSAVSIDVINQLDGSLEFGNLALSNSLPTISGKSGDRAGLTLTSTTANSNTFGDFNIVLRETANTDYSTLTTSAFRFNRFGTNLIDVLRNGNTTFLGKLTAGVAASNNNDLMRKGEVDAADALKANNIITGYTSGAGVIAGTDTVLQAIQKLNGNTALKADITALPTSGTYIPTLTGTANISSIVLSNASYTRVGNVVTVSLGVTITVISPNVITSFTSTLPISRASSANYYIGNGCSSNIATPSSTAPVIIASNATTTALSQFYPSLTGNFSTNITFQYITTW